MRTRATVRSGSLAEDRGEPAPGARPWVAGEHPLRPSATELFGPAGTPRVVVVGAGIGGIAAGVKLRRAGIETFTIYESSTGVGGTWWDNTYPGAEVDVHSDLYSYSFKSYDWTRTHARQPELQSYLEESVDEFGLRPHLRLGVGVCSATWDEASHTWSVTLDDGAVDSCHVLISAVGFLNVPRYPDWPGLQEFEGPKFHTSRWEHQHDLSDKVVAVVGSGSTATQVVPALQPTVRKLYLFQREPGWVMPKGERAFTEAERRHRRKPWHRPVDRAKMRYSLEKGLWGGATFRPGSKLHEKRQQACLDYISEQSHDDPTCRRLSPRPIPTPASAQSSPAPSTPP